MDLRRVDLNLLVALRALLEEQNVTVAARRMQVSQPSTSASLARARIIFEDELLVRVGRRMERTPFAESLLIPLQEALGDVERVMSLRASFDPRTTDRTFTVAATDYMTFVFLRKILDILRAQAPSATLRIEQVLTDYRQQVRSGEIDFLILPEEVAGEVDDLDSVALFTDHFIGAASADNPHIDRLTAEDFDRQPYVAYRVNGTASNVDAQLLAIGRSPSVEMTTESFIIPALMLPGTPLIALVHERTLACLPPASGIRAFTPPFDLAPIHQRLFWHPRHATDPGHRWLQSLMAEHAAAEPEHPGIGKGLAPGGSVIRPGPARDVATRRRSPTVSRRATRHRPCPRNPRHSS